MPPTKPPENECKQFRDLVEKTKEPEVKKYVEKAYWAFCDGHLEAAVLLAWAGVERYASLVVQSVGKSYFDFCYNANTGKDPLPNYTISQLVKMSGRSRFFIGFFEPLREFRELRHKVAHGTGYFVSRPSLIIARLRAVEDAFKRLCHEELIDNPKEPIA